MADERRRGTNHGDDHARRNTKHVNANVNDHDHDHDHDGRSSRGRFPHERLDAYRVALKLAESSDRLAAGIPRGHRSLADQLLRAGSNAVLLLAEGANRRGVGEKRQRFVESRGECGEVAAAADLARALGLAEEVQVDRVKTLAGRVAAMLTRLIARLT